MREIIFEKSWKSLEKLQKLIKSFLANELTSGAPLSGANPRFVIVYL